MGSCVNEMASSGNRLSGMNIPLPPTPPVSKAKLALKYQQRQVSERTTAYNNSNYLLGNTVAMEPDYLNRKESSDSGLASAEVNKRQSHDSDELVRSHLDNALETSSSDISHIGRDCNGGCESASPLMSNQIMLCSSRDTLPDHMTCNGTHAFQSQAGASEKYLSTASDRAADCEVCSILRIPCETDPSWKPIAPDPAFDSLPCVPVSCDPNTDGTFCEPSPLIYCRREPPPLRVKRYRENSRNVKCASADESSPHRLRLATLTDSECADEVDYHQERSLLRGRNRIKAGDCSSFDPNPHIRIQAREQSRVEDFTKRLVDGGISSSDTRRSSIRYEPVRADRGFDPPSPPVAAQRRNPNVNRSSIDVVSDAEEEDEEPRDLPEEERHPLNSHHRERSPTSEHRLQHSQRSSAYLQRVNPERVYAPTTSYNEPRHHCGVPRMCAGAVQPVPAHTSAYPPSAGLQQTQQNPCSVMAAHVATSSGVPDADFFPVVTTTLKLAHEEDESGLWSYTRGGEQERSQFPNYPGPRHPPHAGVTASSGPGPGRFFGNNPSALVSGRPRARESKPYNGTFSKLRKGCRGRCSWKCAALSFVVISLLQLAFIAYLIVQSLNGTAIDPAGPSDNQCNVAVKSQAHTALVDVGASFNEIQLGRPNFFKMAPQSFQRMLVYMEEGAHLKFNFTVSHNSLLAVYGRKGLAPTHTKFDFLERIDGSKLPTSLSSSATRTSFLALTTTSSGESYRSKRSASAGSRIPVEFLEYMDAGAWHIAVYNDRDQEDVLKVVTSLSRGLTFCPNECSSNGECQSGVCQCFHGFSGSDCSQVSCPVTCRGNGEYSYGRCVCYLGWKGTDCATPSDHCVDPMCGGHGECSLDGECVCESGYKGESCTETDCYDPSCSGHGACVEGACKCDRGWKGTVCSEEDLVCLPNCSGHGLYDDTTKMCTCDPGWGGVDCGTASCRPMCDPSHGTCVDGACRCHVGWGGEACDVRQCHARCEEHGSCVRGLCVCDRGWNGELCTFDGCPKDCSRNGECASNSLGDWFCNCHSGWKGPGCSVMVETNCGDGRDSDMDTLIDCQDPDCCGLRSCSRTSQCRGGPDPSHVASTARVRDSISPTASFYDRVKFLVHRNGVQTNAAASAFEPRRASVIRGQVITSDGSPLVGVQVEVLNQAKYGVSKTRADGWFDLMVNGGGSVHLRFQRSAFDAVLARAFVPWGVFVVLPVTTMRTLRQPKLSASAFDGNRSCDISLLAPPSAAILASEVRAYTAAECAEKGSIVPEIQAVREAVPLPGTQTSLVYLSSRTVGYKSKLDILLIDGLRPANLLEVSIVVTVQGKQFEKVFAPVSDLKYTFEWAREDAYGQKVYGSVDIEVMVGYRYDSCSALLWKKLRSRISGHDPSVEKSVGFWTLDVHHTYHPEKGVVHLGNGGEMLLRDQPPMISTVMGDGSSRHTTCQRCDGPADRSKLLSPVALASDATGNIFVGDHDYIRKLDTTGNVSSLFSTRSPPTKYYMAVNPAVDGALYFSDPIQKRIYKLRRMSMPKSRRTRDLTTNQELVAGNGASCYPLHEGNCGDGGPATSATLTSPKGLAIDDTGHLYFVDGSLIRAVNLENGTISTLAGRLAISGTRPMSCSGSMSLNQLELNYPTDLSINPRDGALFVLDGDFIIKIDIHARQASLVAGVPPHCARRVAKSPDNRAARKVHLVSPTSIAVSVADGSLYVAETDQAFVNRVRRVDPYTGRISTVAGIDSRCDCATQECQCFGGDRDFARSASLHNPIAITTTPDGSVYVADQLNLRIRKIWHSLPSKRDDEYRVSDPDTNLLYRFDSHGRHLETRNVFTSTSLYQFSYERNGYLATVTDVNGNVLRFHRAVEGRPESLILPNRDVISLRTNQGDVLSEISKGSTVLASFTYHGVDTHLLRSATRGRYATTFYVFDAQGRLVSTTSSIGSVTTLHAASNSTTHVVTMKTLATSAGDVEKTQIGAGRRDVVIATQPGYLCDLITTQEGAMTTIYKRWTDNSISVLYLDDSELILETKPHPLLGLTAPSLAKRTIQLPSDPLENKIEWQTRKETENGVGTNTILLGRRMRVNDRNILSLDFSQGMMMEKIYDDHTKFMLRVQYNEKGLPIQWMPNGGITPVNVTYDARGHAVTWQRGSKNEEVRYDTKGKPETTLLPDGSSWRRSYSGKVVQLHLPGSTSHFTFTYNDNNSLKKLTSPADATYAVDRRVGIGFVRTAVSGPDGAFTVIQDRNDHGDLLSTFYPGENRKVLFRYDVHGHITEVLHDSTRTRMLRDPHSGELATIATADCTLRFHRNGPLVRRHVVTSTEAGGLLAVFNYTHDGNLRLRSLEVKVNDTRLEAEHLSYNDVSGKLTTFGPYRIIVLTPAVYVVGDESVTLMKKLDNSGRVVDVQVDAMGMIVVDVKMSYDAGGRITRQETTLSLGSNASSYDYYYDSVGNLVRVDQNDKIRWQYTYDSDGKLTGVARDGTTSTLRYDSQGRLKTFGDVEYVFDEDGYLQQRGNEVFEYDSLGHLVRAYKQDNSYEIMYSYDGFGRLTTKVDVLSDSVIRYLYADISKPQLLTHVYVVNSGYVITLRYDVEGHVFALDRSDGVSWSIVCDHLGTPLVAMDKAGTILKNLGYSPFGEVVYDSNPEMSLHIGFRGGIYDVDTRLVHFHDRGLLSPIKRPKISSARPLGQLLPSEEGSTVVQSAVDYDPLIGQFTSAGIERIPLFNADSFPFRLYQVTDPANHHPSYRHMTDTHSWLKSLGFNLQNVAPDPQIATRQKDKSSAECQLSHHLASYMNLQTATPSVLLPGENQMRTSSVEPNGAMFARGLVVSIDRGLVSAQVTDSASDDVKRFSSVVSGSRLLIGRDADSSLAAMSLHHDHKPVLYLSKSASAFAKDMQTMQLQAGRDKILQSGGPIGLRLRGAEMHAESEYALVVVFYVSDDAIGIDGDFPSVARVREKVLSNAKSQAESDAWRRERRKIQSGLKSRWTSAQRRDILARGRLADYKVDFAWNPETYPEMADSGRNVVFVRRT